MLAHGHRGKIYDGRSCFGMCWLCACRDCLKTIRGCVHQVSSITTIIGCSWSVAQILRAFSCDETRARVLQSGRLATEQNKLQVMRVSPSCVGRLQKYAQRRLRRWHRFAQNVVDGSAHKLRVSWSRVGFARLLQSTAVHR